MLLGQKKPKQETEASTITDSIKTSKVVHIKISKTKKIKITFLPAYTIKITITTIISEYSEWPYIPKPFLSKAVAFRTC